MTRRIPYPFPSFLRRFNETAFTQTVISHNRRVFARIISIANDGIVIGNAGTVNLCRFTLLLLLSVNATVPRAVSISNAAVIISCITVAPVAVFFARNQAYVPFSACNPLLAGFFVFLPLREKRIPADYHSDSCRRERD